MARITWTSIAKVLRDEYVEEGKCKICKKTIVEPGMRGFEQLNRIYKHFKENHPNVIEEAKSKIA